MKYLKDDLKGLDRKFRLNLINSLSGIKPANLIGTRSKKGLDNLAIFSSVVHLGSNPAQMGMVVRPQHEDMRDTYRNILETGVYTINHVNQSLSKRAHYTSAKLSSQESEFERMNIGKVDLDGFKAPFVKLSPIKLGMSHLKSIELPNRCLFVIGEIESIYVHKDLENESGRLDLAKADVVGVSGLNTYYALNRIAEHPYVRTNEIPDFKNPENL